MQKVMNIVIISNFAMDFSSNDNDRFLYIANELSKENTVEFITSNFFHTKKEKRDSTVAKWPFKITFLKEPGYHRNVCVKRFLSHYAWGKNVAKYLETIEKPDVIYCAMPSLTAAYMTAKFCKKNGVKFVIDVQDLWPEAFRMVLNIPFVSALLFSPFTAIANYAYSKADAICAVSNTYVVRALKVNKKVVRGTTVYLGTELSHFDECAQKEPVVFHTNKSETWLGYCGTLGSSYDLTSVFDALKILQKKGKRNIKFIVMGDGPQYEEFKKYAKDNLLNVTFTGRLPYDKMCATLCQCDIAINPIMPNSAASIINKHADYAAAGIPVINTQESLEYRNLVDDYNMGLNCKNKNARDLAEKINLLLDNVELRIHMGENARRCAKEKFDRKQSYQELFDIILK